MRIILYADHPLPEAGYATTETYKYQHGETELWLKWGCCKAAGDNDAGVLTVDSSLDARKSAEPYRGTDSHKQIWAIRGTQSAFAVASDPILASLVCLQETCNVIHVVHGDVDDEGLCRYLVGIHFTCPHRGPLLH